MGWLAIISIILFLGGLTANSNFAFLRSPSRWTVLISGWSGLVVLVHLINIKESSK
jgi:hypothetical protein